MKRLIHASTGCRIGRVVDGEHRTLQHVGALFGQQPGELRFLAGFQDKNAIACQSVCHDVALTRLALCLFILMLGPGLAQGHRG